MSEYRGWLIVCASGRWRWGAGDEGASEARTHPVTETSHMATEMMERRVGAAVNEDEEAWRAGEYHRRRCVA
jgi:hypothetical protein